MSKTIIAVRHFGLGGRESLETAVKYFLPRERNLYCLLDDTQTRVNNYWCYIELVYVQKRAGRVNGPSWFLPQTFFLLQEVIRNTQDKLRDKLKSVTAS